MSRDQINLVIVSQHGDQFQGVPGGMGYVDEIIREAGIPANSSPTSDDELWLPVCLSRINRQFGQKIHIQLVNPLSLYGLYLSIRFRFRGYPAAITPSGRLLIQPSIDELIKSLEEYINIDT